MQTTEKMRRDGKWIATALITAAVAVGSSRSADAFEVAGAQIVSHSGPTGTCLNAILDGSANVALINTSSGSGNDVGGSFFVSPGITPSGSSPVTTADLTYCGYVNPVITSQNGADGTFATDGYIGIIWEAQETVGGTLFRYEFALSGIATTIVINTRTAVAQGASTVIYQFQQSRANQLLQSQPGLTPFLSTTAQGRFDADVTQGVGQFNFATRGDLPVWTRLSGAWSKEGARDTTYVFGALGAHATISENLLIGGLLEFDYAEQSDASSSVDGNGWLAGPYFVTKLPDQPLYVEGRLLYGRSTNDVSTGGAAPDSFDTERFLAQVKMTGEIDYGTLKLFPALDISYTSDDQKSYIAAGGVVPGQKVEQGQVKLGLGFEKALFGSSISQTVTLNGGAYAVYADTSSSGSTAIVSEVDGTRGRIELGSDFQTSSGGQFKVKSFYDGIGKSQFESYGFELGYNFKF